VFVRGKVDVLVVDEDRGSLHRVDPPKQKNPANP
jgi:hypothetical protein